MFNLVELRKLATDKKYSTVRVASKELLSLINEIELLREQLFNAEQQVIRVERERDTTLREYRRKVLLEAAERLREVDTERNSNMDEILKLREELERERMRLAACGVVALANTPDSAEKARTMHDDYRSASCDDVARAVDRQMALHNALTAVMSYPGVRDYLGRQVSEIADSALMGPNS